MSGVVRRMHFVAILVVFSFFYKTEVKADVIKSSYDTIGEDYKNEVIKRHLEKREFFWDTFEETTIQYIKEYTVLDYKKGIAQMKNGRILYYPLIMELDEETTEIVYTEENGNIRYQCFNFGNLHIPGGGGNVA